MAYQYREVYTIEYYNGCTDPMVYAKLEQAKERLLRWYKLEVEQENIDPLVSPSYAELTIKENGYIPGYGKIVPKQLLTEEDYMELWGQPPAHSQT